MQIIFDNFPYSNGNHAAHVWNFDGDELRWSDISRYISEKTKVPLHYIKIRDPEKGLSCRINLDLNNNDLVNLDKFKSTYKSEKSKIVDVWFQIYLNFFSKK